MVEQVVDQILVKHNYESSSLVAILQEIQGRFNYLPEEGLKLVSQRLNLPLSRLYAVATFYKSYSLKPKGKHLIHLCQGTACHVRGAPLLLSKLKGELAVEPGETTRDKKFTLETVRCLGCCSLAPVVRVDKDTFGKVTQRQLKGILEKYHG